MIRQIQMVQDFHKAFGLTTSTEPTYPNMDIAGLRVQLHEEECKEVTAELKTLAPKNMDKIAKELVDLLYVVYGTIVTYGLQDKIEEVFSEIHRANMSKLGKDGKAIINGENGVLDTTRPMGKVLKSENYKPADVSYLF